MEYLTPACAARCIITLKFFAMGYIFFTKLVSEISIFLNLKFFFCNKIFNLSFFNFKFLESGVCLLIIFHTNENL